MRRPLIPKCLKWPFQRYIARGFRGVSDPHGHLYDGCTTDFREVSNPHGHLYDGCTTDFRGVSDPDCWFQTLIVHLFIEVNPVWSHKWEDVGGNILNMNNINKYEYE